MGQQSAMAARMLMAWPVAAAAFAIFAHLPPTKYMPGAAVGGSSDYLENPLNDF